MSVNSFREDEEQKVQLKKDIITRTLGYMRPYKSKIAIVLGVMAVTIAITIINPLLIERALNDFVPMENKSAGMRGLLILAGIAVILNIVYTIAVRIRMTMMASISNSIIMKIREELYYHIQTLGFKFFDSRPTGKILARITGDVNSLKDMLSNFVTTLIPDFLTLVVVLAVMLIKSPVLSLAALLTLPFLVGGMFLIQIISHKRWQAFRKKSSNLNAFTHEDFSGIRVIQSFSAEHETREDFEQLSSEYHKSFVRAVRWGDSFGPLIDLMWVIGGMILYWLAARMVGAEDSGVGIGTIIAFSTYMGMFWSPIRNLSNFYNQLITNMSAAERIFDILDTEPEIVDSESCVELPEIRGDVEFCNVSFSYEDDENTHVLDNVSFSVKAGETIALVGPTGAGKTTIVNLISRFYDVQQGDILIDGHSLRDVSIASLRRQMGVMTQDNFIFSGTVRDNIRYGRLDATDEEIEAAAKATGAHEFITKMEKGYDTELSEQGSGLSVGQRQLIAFARTMVSSPRILILDEATSSIDTHTELVVQAGIAVLLKGRTSFVIAHRLSTIKRADRIFVINHGGIQEAGSHDELMKKRGEYYELYQAQFKSLRPAAS